MVEVLDLLDLLFAELTLWNYKEHLGNFTYFLGLCITDRHLLTFSVPFSKFPLFLLTEGANRWTIVKNPLFQILWNIPDISRGSTQATLSQRQRKFELFNPSQAKLEEQQV